MQQKFTNDKEERMKIAQLVKLMKNNANTSEEISNNLPRIKSYIESIDECIIAGKSIGNFKEGDIKNWVTEFRSNFGKETQDKEKQDIEKEMLAVIDRAIELKREFKLRDTQKLTVLALLTNDRSTLAQVSTGEGKSLIVVAASIMKALYGKNVDIITSSSVLAKRDAEGNTDVYNLFAINVSHNCSEDIEKRREVYSGNQVVYGDLSNFQRDYLLDRFYGKNILGNHNFNSVIVDEVDSMLLDKGNNMLYLSHDLAGLDKLESVYIYIWQWINRPAKDCKDLSYAFDTKAIKEAVISDLYGLVKKEDIGKLGSKLSEQQKNIIWKRLVTNNILDDQGKLSKETIDSNKLNEVISPEFDSYRDRLSYLLKECIEREKIIHVSNHLKPFIEQHLESWIKSAITAFFMKAGEDYLVDVDKTQTSPDRNPRIIILDRDTGTDQANSQWDEALHQFLQLKHGCKLSLQSLKAVFISNASFFKLYSNLCGLTGTLGSQRERDLLKEIHGVDYVTIPTARSKQFHEDKPILCTGKKEWINHVHDEAKKLAEGKKKQRSVLIICETVNDVETLYKAFVGKSAEHVHTYTRDYEEFDIAKGNKELEQGQIIIATNLAGRGTDIKISEGLRKAGGLHVCLTYLPGNIRIEEQAFGRAARSGDEGSGRLIIMDSKGEVYSNSKVLDLKKERNTEELHRVSKIKAYYETQITMEERCFKSFKKHYERLKKDLDDTKVPAEIKEILLQSCLDKWAFWLDKNSKSIKNVTDEQSKRNFNSLLHKFISQFKNFETGYDGVKPLYNMLPIPIIEYDSKSWLVWVTGNPFQMVKLGRYLSQNEGHKNAHENALKLFDEVIKNEPYFSEAAHYYKAFALAKEIDWEQNLKKFKLELREAARLLDEHSKFAIHAAAIIGKIKKNNKESIIQIDAYEEQKEVLANLYYMFSRSIDDIFGHFITPQSFANNDVTEELAKVLYEDLIREGVLKKTRVKKSILDEELKAISLGYGISVQELKDFLSKYEGKEIEEKKFQKALKRDIRLPGREGLWKLLIHEEVLSEEVKYVIVDNEKLREVDSPSFDFLTEKVNEEELKKQVLEANNEQILLNVVWITQQRHNYSIFIKEDFIEILGEDKYEMLKEKGVLSFNRKANINVSEIESLVLSDYDSITIKDFTNKANITESEAEKILIELVKDGVLEKCPKSSVHRLKIEFDEIEQVQLSFCSAYENAVKGLLSVCFTYRVAIQKIASQLETLQELEKNNLLEKGEEKKSPVHLQLMTKPHQSLFLELLEQQIIKPVTVARKDKDLKKDKVEKTVKGALNKMQLITEPHQNLLLKLVELQQIIQPLTMENTFEKGVVREALNKLQLTKDITKHIIRTLERSGGSLKALKVPDSKLKPFTELCDQGVFANIEEMHVFSLNGLDQLLQLEEKKWTREMLLNTLIVTAMGLTQIAIGTAIELFSAGIMTHVGAAFINEGVSDLFFAASALKSGYFSWEDYRQHKLQSLMMTAVTVGVGAYLSGGAKVSRFGHKIAGPSFEVGGKKVAEISGTQLIRTAGWKVVGKEVTKRIVRKAAEGVAFGLANAGVDTLVEKHLQGLCKGIASNILSNIEQEVEKHKISASLKEVYKTLGEEKAKKMVNDSTQSTLIEKNCEKNFLPITFKIVSSVTQGIAEATKKRSKVGGKLEFPIHTISKIVVWSERSSHIFKILGITGSLLNNLDKKIKDKLNNDKLKKNTEQNLLNEKQETEKNWEIFKKEVIDQWKSLLHERVGLIIAQHIVSPILKEGTNHLIRYVGKNVQKVYQSYKESEYLEQFGELKQEYEKKLQNEQQCDNVSKLEKHTAEKYSKVLLKLMKKTRNPHLFARIVKENIPMDLTCVKTCTQVVHEILKNQGVEISGLTIIVEGCNEKGQNFSQKFSSAPDGVEGRITIKLTLQDYHFQLCGSSVSESNSGGNNCLYEALAEAMPQIRAVTPEEFRAGIANSIEKDPKIRYHIQQGQHRLPISLDAFGGDRRERSQRRDDPDSSPSEIKNVSDHLVDRLERYFCFGGMMQKISELTNIRRDKLVNKGKARFQDRSCKIKGYQAGHVVRAGNLYDDFGEFKDLKTVLKNFLGHTQNVPTSVNVYHGLGGDIDRFQSDNLNVLKTTNFSKSFTTDDIDRTKNLVCEYIQILDYHIKNGKFDGKVKSELRNAKKTLSTNFEKNDHYFFEIGKTCYYSDKLMDAYR